MSTVARRSRGAKGLDAGDSVDPELVKVLPLDRVTVDLGRQEIVGLVGQNGSGKSTLIKVLAGFHEPDPGSAVELDGTPMTFGDPAAARGLGLRFVHQDLALVLDLSVTENLALGRGYATGVAGRIRWGAEHRDAVRRLRELGYDIDVRLPVGKLGAAERSGVAVARALEHWEDARVLVVDEPTASLPAAEVHILLQAIERVRRGGLSVIYVSHRLDEVLGISDRLVVLRDGRVVTTVNSKSATEADVIARMVGQEVLSAPSPRKRSAPGGPVLAVKAVGGVVVVDATFEVHAGEVLGIAGLRGSGREELLSLIFGSQPRLGEVRVDGQVIVDGNPTRSMAAGMALVPSDRRGQGSIGGLTLRENCTLTDLERHSNRLGAIDRRQEKEEVRKWIADLDIKPQRTEANFATLSGGNQQKVVFAKWLRRSPRVLLLDEPSQGVDVQAKATIHRLARDTASNGSAVLVASSDDNELCDICDRVLIMRDGTVAGQLAGDEVTPHRLASLQLGEATRNGNADPARIQPVSEPG
jgi:ribose transport system ATP-binding protein